MNTKLRRLTLADLLHRSAKRFPDKTAIICGDTVWSYAVFDALCDRLAHLSMRWRLRRRKGG
jgi:fatty-acyl-CoA synthase